MAILRARKVLFAFLALLLISVAYIGIVLSIRQTHLSVAFNGAIDGHGHWKLRFAITNTGSTTIFSSGSGKIEIFDRTNAFWVGASAPRDRLAPSEGEVIEAVISDAEKQLLTSRWRYTCLYPTDGLRTRIYHWQWGVHGPGKRINWLIPNFLKGARLNAVGTSDWIEPVK